MKGLFSTGCIGAVVLVQQVFLIPLSSQYIEIATVIIDPGQANVRSVWRSAKTRKFRARFMPSFTGIDSAAG